MSLEGGGGGEYTICASTLVCSLGQCLLSNNSNNDAHYWNAGVIAHYTYLCINQDWVENAASFMANNSNRL